MPNYNLYISSKFNPFTFDDYVKPLDKYKQFYENTEKEYKDLLNKTDILSMYLNSPNNSDLKSEYDNYVNRLNSSLEKLHQLGLIPNVRNDLLQLHRDYTKQILPIDNAIATLQKLQKEQRENSMRDQTLLYDNDFNDVNFKLQEIINNPGISYKGYSGKDVRDKAKNMAEKLKNTLNQETTSDEKGITTTVKSKYDINDIQAYANKEKEDKILDEIVNTALKGIPSDMIEDLRPFAIQGLYDAIGRQEETFTPTESPTDGGDDGSKKDGEFDFSTIFNQDIKDNASGYPIAFSGGTNSTEFKALNDNIGYIEKNQGLVNPINEELQKVGINKEINPFNVGELLDEVNKEIEKIPDDSFSTFWPYIFTQLPVTADAVIQAYRNSRSTDSSTDSENKNRLKALKGLKRDLKKLQKKTEALPNLSHLIADSTTDLDNTQITDIYSKVLKLGDVQSYEYHPAKIENSTMTSFYNNVNKNRKNYLKDELSGDITLDNSQLAIKKDDNNEYKLGIERGDEFSSLKIPMAIEVDNKLKGLFDVIDFTKRDLLVNNDGKYTDLNIAVDGKFLPSVVENLNAFEKSKGLKDKDYETMANLLLDNNFLDDKEVEKFKDELAKIPNSSSKQAYYIIKSIIQNNYDNLLKKYYNNGRKIGDEKNNEKYSVYTIRYRPNESPTYNYIKYLIKKDGDKYELLQTADLDEMIENQSNTLRDVDKAVQNIFKDFLIQYQGEKIKI